MEPPEVTELLNRAARGDRQAEENLLGLVYTELRQMAAHHLRLERPNHTLQATALVHEAYVRLMGQHGTDWKGRAHFFGFAAQVMRHVLVDYARQRQAGRRYGVRVPLADGLAVADEQCVLIADLDEALRRLEQMNARQAKIVELRFFSGMKMEEIAELLDISVKTVNRDWTIARAWLYGELSGENHGG